MKEDLWRKGASVGVATSLVILVFIVLIPSATTAVKVSGGIPSDTSVNVRTTIFFQNVNLTIRAAEAIPVNFLLFEIFDSTTDKRVAWVRFTITGNEMSENPPGAFTVANETDTSVLPHQCRGDYYGYDERIGYNVTGFHHGFGYGYGYGNPDLLIVYNIPSMPQRFLAFPRLFVWLKHTSELRGKPGIHRCCLFHTLPVSMMTI